jgi:hypothetical protein
MRRETKAKLDKLAITDRRHMIGAAMLLLSIPAAYWLLPYRSQRNVEAEVRIAYLGNNTETGQRFMRIEALLEDGTMVRSGGRPLMPPSQGSKIVLRERASWFGYRSYYWEGPAAN